MKPVRFDDRLRTVLEQPSGDPHDRAVRWRQLVDLVARSGPGNESPYIRAALDVLARDRPSIDESVRAAAAQAIANRPLPLDLVRLFASDRLKVCAPVLASATLDVAEWRSLAEGAAEENRKFIMALHPETASLSAREPAPTAPESPSISDVIDRIERLREAREKAEPPSEPAPPAAAEDGGLFRWESTTGGEFAWVDGAPRAALVGRPLFDSTAARGQGRSEIARAFTDRAPFRNAVMTLAEDLPLAGEWQVSGVPAFEPATGRFMGYRGVAKQVSAAAAQFETPHPDSLRELVHEIKTPLNAIMGFAEIIEGQIFGPADEPYRQRAAQIVAQAHLLLGAIEDLDFAAKLRSGEEMAGGQADLAHVLEAIESEILKKAQQAGVELRSLVEPHLPICGVDGALIERLLTRLVGVLIASAHPGETVQMTAAQWNDRCSVAIGRPLALQGVHDQELLDPRFTVSSIGQAKVSIGFLLRLVRGIAQFAGGDLVLSGGKVVLVLPRAGLRSPVQRRYRRFAGRGL